jgi:hypothetical protein
MTGSSSCAMTGSISCGADFTFWNLRGATVWCGRCGCHTDHSTAWHRERLAEGRRKR